MLHTPHILTLAQLHPSHSPTHNPHPDKPQSTAAGESCTLESPSQLPLECCSAPVGLVLELSLPPAAAETTDQLQLVETPPVPVLLKLHCVTGLPV